MVTEGATGKPSGDHVCRWGGALRWCQSFPCWCWSGARWSSARVLRCANHDWGNYLGAEGGPGEGREGVPLGGCQCFPDEWMVPVSYRLRRHGAEASRNSRA
jgi:hypothetical protein